MQSTPLVAPQLPMHPPALRPAGIAYGVGLPPAPPSVPFSANPAQGPPPVGFGFGCGSAGTSAAPVSPGAPRPDWRAAKRQRDDEEYADEDMDEPKRRRAPTRPAAHADLGSALAALDRPALLGLLHDLTSSDEAIAARVYTRLPTPSLESVGAQLTTAEMNLRSVLPAPGSARDQYVWGRVRAPLAALASTLAGVLPLFAASSSRREPVHPATAFAFLHMVTLRVMQLERLLPAGERARDADAFADMVPARAAADSPDALASMVFPALLREWQHWLSAVDTAVNRDGRMYGHDVVTAWMRGLQALGPVDDALPTEGAMRAALGDVLGRLQCSLGWLVGIRFPM